jgi:nucleotide-binding universal stress UspA family protein
MAIERILIGTDFSPCARGALDFALELAQKQGARISMLHAWNAPPIVSAVDAPPLIEMPGLPGVTLTEYVHDDAERALTKLVEEVRARAPALESQLLLGDPRNVIVEASSRYDLVVLGTHGRGGLARMLLGSVADYVVRHAQCPVLTVRPLR